MLGYGGIGPKITQTWKWLKGPANPPAQVRNLVSNMVLLNLSGVPLYRRLGYRSLEPVVLAMPDGLKFNGVRMEKRLNRELADLAPAA